MEHLWPRVALEQEVIALASIVRSIAGGAVLAPLLAFGHGSEFIATRLMVEDDGTVALQMVADYGDNPLIPDERAAEAAMKGLLRVVVGPEDKPVALEELAPIRFSKAAQWPADTPATIGSPVDALQHQLLIGSWGWRPNSRQIVFEVPQGNRHDALMWRRETGKPAEQTRWLALIAGDKTPPIEVPSAKQEAPKHPWLGIVGLVLLVIMGFLQARRGKQRARRMMGRR